MSSLELAKEIAQRMLDKQAEDVVILDLRELTTIADFFVIGTGSVDVHVKAIADNVDRSLRRSDDPLKPLHLEGYSHLHWVLLDYGDVVAHVFEPRSRNYYQLEGLWGDAPRIEVEDNAA